MKIIKTVWSILGILYFPIYLIAWILHKVSRLLLAISYLGMLNIKISKDIITNLFIWNGRH